MKREWIALLLICVILAGGRWDRRKVEALTEELLAGTDAAYAAAELGRREAAQKAAEAAEEAWRKEETFVCVFIRHSEADALTDALCAFRGAVAGQDEGELLAAYLSLRARISRILDMEKLSVGSIF
jgi:hypothetical protein